jgi:hypothetical protein
MRLLTLLLAILTSWPSAADAPPSGWDARRLTVPVVVGEQPIPFPVFALYAMPGQVLTVTFAQPHTTGSARYGGRSIPLPGNLTAPDEPGLSLIEIAHDGGETQRINLFTMVPAVQVDQAGRMNGYRIGGYPQQPLRGLDIYRPPAGFVEVTPQNAQTRVSPNFRLGQFVSKQDQGHPKYVVLREPLLHKLETILAALNARGRPTPGLVVMSGFRTPWYNRAIGNVAYSRHVWGGAADIYVDDSPADGLMDDLDGNGRIDRGDALWLAEFVEALARDGAFGVAIGGLGVYDSTPAHGPFIHVDVRGSPARW